MDNFVNYPQIGKTYRHYKGGLYKVITMATHSETDEAVVVYQSLLFGSFHVRPLSMWYDKVNLGKSYSQNTRFELLHESHQ